MLGNVVIGKKPWNNKYNVGLVVEEAKDISKVRNHDSDAANEKENINSYKILWTTPKQDSPEESWEYKLYAVLPKPEVCYTWEVGTSIECISGVQTSGRS